MLWEIGVEVFVERHEEAVGPVMAPSGKAELVALFVGDCAGQTLWQTWTEDNGINIDDLGFWCGFLVFTTVITLVALSLVCTMGGCMGCLAAATTLHTVCHRLFLICRYSQTKNPSSASTG